MSKLDKGLDQLLSEEMNFSFLLNIEWLLVVWIGYYDGQLTTAIEQEKAKKLIDRFLAYVESTPTEQRVAALAKAKRDVEDEFAKFLS